MTNDEIHKVVEWEGWFYLLTRISPDEVSDAAVGEALAAVQEALRFLIGVLPGIEELEIFDDTSLQELNFG
jgi:hypothetical protein